MSLANKVSHYIFKCQAYNCFLHKNHPILFIPIPFFSFLEHTAVDLLLKVYVFFSLCSRTYLQVKSSINISCLSVLQPFACLIFIVFYIILSQIYWSCYFCILWWLNGSPCMCNIVLTLIKNSILFQAQRIPEGLSQRPSHRTGNIYTHTYFNITHSSLSPSLANLIWFSSHYF